MTKETNVKLDSVDVESVHAVMGVSEISKKDPKASVGIDENNKKLKVFLSSMQQLHPSELLANRVTCQRRS